MSWIVCIISLHYLYFQISLRALLISLMSLNIFIITILKFSSCTSAILHFSWTVVVELPGSEGGVLCWLLLWGCLGIWNLDNCDSCSWYLVLSFWVGVLILGFWCPLWILGKCVALFCMVGVLQSPCQLWPRGSWVSSVSRHQGLTGRSADRLEDVDWENSQERGNLGPL